MKQGILFKISGNSSWIGGVYYIKNIIFSLLQNSMITDKYNIIICVNETSVELTNAFRDKAIIISCKEKEGSLLACLRWFFVISKYRIKYVYGIAPGFKARILRALNVIPIYWIPDFQDKHFPDFFSKDQLKIRDRRNAMMLHDSSCPLVLSSQDAKHDFETYVSPKREHVYVIPFVSYIEEHINAMTPKLEKQILDQYHLTGRKYILISNQFWKHKNHLTVLKAIAYLKQKQQLNNITFVFTGQLLKGSQREKYGNEYYEKLEQIIDEEQLMENIMILGFIERAEQLVLMKHAHFILQPSLFEGWGTVLEDAKVLDKTVLLSDINVHREQKNNKCLLFNPNDEIDLANKIVELSKEKLPSDVKAGLCDMYCRAKEYSKTFEEIML